MVSLAYISLEELLMYQVNLYNNNLNCWTEVNYVHVEETNTFFT